MKDKSLSLNLFQKLSKTCIKYCEDKLTEILNCLSFGSEQSIVPGEAVKMQKSM